MDPSDTAVLEKRAPSMARWPRFMRNLRPAVFWGAVALLASGAAFLFWEAVAWRTDTKLFESELAALTQERRANAAMRADVRFTRWQVSVLMYDHDWKAWVLTADWNKRHRLPVPPQPQAPPPNPPADEPHE